MPMTPSVTAAWPAFCDQFEGRCAWMYLDTKGKVTTGLGDLIDSQAAAAELPWLTKSNVPASRNAVFTEWQRVKDLQDWKNFNGLSPRWRETAQLHITNETIDARLMLKTNSFWATLTKTLPAIETFPADAQLALMDLAWQNGPAFLDSWNDTRKAVLAQDWAKTAAVLTASLKASPRTTARVRLFLNAQVVKANNLDKTILWDTKKPTVPVVVKPPDQPAPRPDEEEVLPVAARVSFRGWWTCSCAANSLPYVELDMLLRGQIKESIDIYQAIGAFGPSAGTHMSGGVMDVAQFNPDQIDTWRRWGWTMQKRVGVGSGLHAHGWPYGCPHLAPDAKAQNNDWNRKDAGLVGGAKVVGRWPVKRWDVALRENKGALMSEFEKMVTRVVKEQVLAALDQDGVVANVGNAGALTGNPDNKTISYRTAIQSGFNRVQNTETRVKRLEAALVPAEPVPATGEVKP